ncbi:hypothetical protein Mal64_22550 [Pseudobythopirellula maris]|uniref:Rod shape-determining protein MreD n=1 Tax=Pseudobythopirellula maris TaxID=2527991 RepID=A0A5C5ZPF7_9BACT|nr:DUF6580 family putative transport protein [Pseudobythopirellula maris]TWT88767.1 hypothetical protein Mal64_22550 [Pseudobythopirellula maris]
MPALRARSTEIAVFALLVAIGVAGRWGQPDWCVTPLAAVGLFAGRYFASRSVAMLVPLTAMLVSDLALPAYANRGVMLAVYAAMVLPPLLGRLLRNDRLSRPAWLGRLAAGAVAPSVVFFLVTNFAYWSLGSLYPHTGAGLMACYAAAVPFFRAMLTGDVVYTALVFGAAMLAGMRAPQAAPARG